MPNDFLIKTNSDCTEDNLDDGFTLPDLWLVLMRRKKIAITVFIAVIIITAIYLFSLKPVYRLEVDVKPPLIEHVEDINKIYKKYINDIDIDNEIYKKFVESLQSAKVLATYFSVPIKNSADSIQVEKIFVYDLKVQQIGKDIKLRVDVSAQELPENSLNKYIYLASVKAVSEVLKEFENRIKNKRQSLLDEIEFKRKIAKKEREDQILILEEQYNIAKNLNLFDFISTVAYWKGTKALYVEINSLKNRKSDDPYIDGLRNMQEILSELNAIDANKYTIINETVGQFDELLIYQTKPNVKFVVILGIILGIILAMFSAILANYIQIIRQRFRDKLR